MYICSHINMYINKEIHDYMYVYICVYMYAYIDFCNICNSGPRQKCVRVAALSSVSLCANVFIYMCVKEVQTRREKNYA